MCNRNCNEHPLNEIVTLLIRKIDADCLLHGYNKAELVYQIVSFEVLDTIIRQNKDVAIIYYYGQGIDTIKCILECLQRPMPWEGFVRPIAWEQISQMNGSYIVIYNA
ncbi:MAG TPA: hypothetical protein VNX68_00090 [Nitrosopumilaceae archaeon]|jgi:hypothetical protein|nr:hypothetical protein [Nitrosopumilaceae archaeon]